MLTETLLCAEMSRILFVFTSAT